MGINYKISNRKFKNKKFVWESEMKDERWSRLAYTETAASRARSAAKINLEIEEPRPKSSMHTFDPHLRAVDHLTSESVDGLLFRSIAEAVQRNLADDDDGTLGDAMAMASGKLRGELEEEDVARIREDEEREMDDSICLTAVREELQKVKKREEELIRRAWDMQVEYARGPVPYWYELAGRDFNYELVKSRLVLQPGFSALQAMCFQRKDQLLRLEDLRRKVEGGQRAVSSFDIAVP